MKKRLPLRPEPEVIDRLMREYFAQLPGAVLQRAAELLRAGKPIPVCDRDLVAGVIAQQATRHNVAMSNELSVNPVHVYAQMVEYVSDRYGVTDASVAEALARKLRVKPGTILRRVTPRRRRRAAKR